VLSLKVWGLQPSRVITLFKQQGLKFGITIINNDLGPGVLISALDPQGIVYRQGLRTGDVILSINDKVVDDHQAAIIAIDESADKATFVYVPGMREPDKTLDVMEA